MANAIPNLFWDTCVFAALLYDEKETYNLADLEKFLADTKSGKSKIYTSSIIFAEIASSKVRRKGIGSVNDLVSDLVGATIVVDASVNIFQMAGRLKDIPYRKNGSTKRALSTGDAVMLATILYIQDGYELEIDVFHTFDNAKKKFVPLLGYHEWCDGLTGERAALAKRICALKREKPLHPAPDLPGI